MRELKRCPFCGGEAKISMFIGNPFVTCTECMGSIFPNVGQSKEEAIKAWNTRKPIERIVERLEEAESYSCSPQFSKAIERAIEIVRECNG